ncbi:glucokinase [Nocardioides gansuensis]|uniref:Glucokinase n=1 Tax=Nocardioides gansuensis TaxID=2138300 RepID=A0A2T8FAK7_9ACTN|nr:ROK family glucokinase [Nocardioides gansuensis]PVG82758.1 glucokinase [Nocardioides gansuensis]
MTGTLACGVDVGGTKIAGGVVDEEGKILERLTLESPAEDVEAIEDAIASLVSDLASRHDVACVGIGAAGYVDSDRRRVYFAPNLAWRDIDLSAELEERVKLPVVVENDANAAAWGEFTFGVGEDVEDFMLVTVGTGVGGGLVLDGALHRGAFGVAAEIGHMRVVPGGILCGCGNRGCLESYGSGTALVREAREAASGKSLLARTLLDRAGGDPEKINGPLITEVARGGDPFSLELIADVGRWLGEGIASLAAVLDPAMVAIGGGVSEAGDLLMDPIRTAFARELSGRGYRPVAQVVRAELGNLAGLVGAADLARRP